MKRVIGLSLAAQVLLFQVFLLTKFRPLYSILRFAFLLSLAAALALLVRRLTRQKALWLVLALVIVVRLPFYLHPEGMVTTSDNAVDALAAAEIRDARQAPFFLLGDVNHMGTLKQLWVAFLWDVAGRNAYLLYLLLQLVIFLGFLLAWDAFLADAVSQNVRLLLLAVNFMFIETVFDYSLSIRGAPYLEMAFFFVLGAAMFDPSFNDGLRLGLSYFFMFFAVYIHPLAAVLAGSFGLAAGLLALASRKFWRHALAVLAGGTLGLFHWGIYLAFLPKPAMRGGFESFGLVPVSELGRNWLGAFAGTAGRTFVNLFEFELRGLSERIASPFVRGAARAVGQAAVVVGVAAILAALAFSVRALWPVIRRRARLEPRLLPRLFFCVLLAACLAKLFLFYPPHLEPRHNFDLAVLLILAFFISAGEVWRNLKVFSWKGLSVLALGLLLAAPPVANFYGQAVDKEKAYRGLLATLRQHKVRVVDTDFILAYCVYYLSNRQIWATDLLGPFRVLNFYPELRDKIDELPVDHRTFILFSKNYPAPAWHKEQSEFLGRHIRNRFHGLGIKFKVVRLPNYTLFIPISKSNPAPDR